MVADANPRNRDRLKQFRNQRLHISKPIGFPVQHYDGNRKRSQVLLKGQISINRDKHVELLGPRAPRAGR